MRYTTIIFLLLIKYSINSQELNTYEAIYNHWEIEGFLNQFNRAIDNEGIVIQKGEYHALIISFYGIINFHEFLKTNDSVYYHRVINQYKYFKDTSKILFFDNGQSVGLPYRKPYNGLAAPWFSGMTQGTAVSYLLRYYKLTGDRSALDLSKKLVKLMIKPEKEGGTLGLSKEGCLWIEEYPNSLRSKSVLNGFINGLIGLKEYLEFYPEDSEVRSVHDECFDAMFLSLKEYDTHSWTSYNRNGKSVSNGYMRYQLSEFDQLFNIYQDTRLIRQMKIWSKMAINKLCKELTFYKYPKFQYADYLKEIETDRFVFSEKERFENSLVNVIKDYEHYQNSRLKKMNFKLSSGHYYLELEFKEDLYSNNLNIEVFKGNEKINSKHVLKENKIIIWSSHSFNEVSISLGKRTKKSNCLIAVKLYDKYKYDLPFFGVINVKNNFTLDKGKKYRIVYSGDNIIDGQVFYRFANSKEELKKQKFQLDNYFELSDLDFLAPESGVYEFFISYSINTPESYIEGFSLLDNF